MKKYKNGDVSRKLTRDEPPETLPWHSNIDTATHAHTHAHTHADKHTHMGGKREHNYFGLACLA